MTPRLPPLYALRAFEAAARLGSFTLAAQSLCITQSAVSRHVRNLEESLGCALFERRGSKLALTFAGRILALELERGFNVIEDACAAASSQRGALRLKAPSTITMRWLLHVLESFQADDQRNRVELTSTWMDKDSVDFRTEPFDCAVLLGTGEFPPEWCSVRLFDEWLVPVCSPAIHADRDWCIQDLGSVELIHPSRDRRDWRRWLERQNAANSISWRADGKLFDTLELGISAAAQGHGVSIGDLALVDAQLRAGSLVMPIRTAVRSGDSYYLVWPERSKEHTLLKPMKDFLLANLPIATGTDMLLLE